MVQENTTLIGGVNKSGFKMPKLKVPSMIKSAWKTALFMEALRNLNWSRGYGWYVELDGVPNPFHRGGVLGLPCKDIQFDLAQGSTFSWESGVNKFEVPQNIGETNSVRLTVFDDEQGTLRQFFERWYNEVYNPYLGVLPVTESCKMLSFYLQKSTRRNVKRVYYDIDQTLSSINNSMEKQIRTKISEKMNQAVFNKRIDDSINFLVFPKNSVSMNYQTNDNELVSFSVDLSVALFCNQDFGNPTVNSGVKTINDTVIGGETTGDSWLDKIADYI